MMMLAKKVTRVFSGRHGELFAISGIIGVAVLLCLNALAHRGPYWSDEMYSLLLADPTISWATMAHYLSLDNSPPLYYLLLRPWLWLFGSSELVARLLSVIFYLLGILCLWRWGRQAYSRQVGLTAAGLAAVSTFLVQYATDTRMYSLVFFLTIGSCYAFWRYFSQPSWWRLLLYLVASLMLVNTHLQGWFIVFAQDVFLLIHFINHNPQKQWDRYIRPFYSQLVVLIISLLWLFPFFIARFVESTTASWYFHMDLGGSVFFGTLLNAFLLSYQYLAKFDSTAVLAIVTLSLFLVPIDLNRVKGRIIISPLIISPAVLFTLVLAIIPTLVGYFFFLAINFFIPYYFTVVIPPLFLLVAIGFDRLRLLSPAAHRMLLFIVVIIVLTNTYVAFDQDRFRHRSDQIAKMISKNEQLGDVIVFQNFYRELPFRKFYHGQAPVIPIYPLENDKTETERWITDNWRWSLNTNNIIVLDQLIPKSAKRIFLVRDTVIDPQDLVLDWLLANGWANAHKQEIYSDGVSRIAVMLLTRTTN